eukprot:12756866-Alexandrium_andersonii.AAC.1
MQRAGVMRRWHCLLLIRSHKCCNASAYGAGAHAWRTDGTPCAVFQKDINVCHAEGGDAAAC